MTSHWTDQQKTIINAAFDQHICIIAGAGCGKTTTLVERVAHILEDTRISHSAILFMTFTKDAAHDMKMKLEKRLETTLDDMWIGTIDSLSKNITERYAPELYETCGQVGEYKYAFLRFLQKEHCPYQKEFLQCIQYIFVDEFQDINEIYYKILHEFHKRSKYINVVGDDAQNIYTWNGSNIQYLLQFTEYFPSPKSPAKYFLTENFRSTPEIVALSNHCISKNQQKIEKQILPTCKSTQRNAQIHQFDTWNREFMFILQRIQSLYLQNIPYHEIAILCRSIPEKAQIYYIEEQLTHHNIPNQLLVTFKDMRNTIKQNHVLLSTIHKSKALEWKVVFVIGCRDRTIQEMQLEEERRLFYVAMTRAKEYLYFTFCSKKKYDFLQFLRELPIQLLDYFYNSNQYPLEEIQSECNHFLTSYIPPPSSFSIVHGVTKMIETLNTEHIIRLKCDTSFPNLSAVQQTKYLYESLDYPEWVKQYNLYAEFGLWIDQVICYQMHPSSTSLNYQALQLCHPLFLDSMLYPIYYKYRPLLEYCVENNYSFVSVEHFLEFQSQDTYLQIIEQPREFYHILQRILRKKKDHPHNIPPFVCKKTFLTTSQWKYLQTMKSHCSDPTRSWQDNLYPLFVLSWCSEIQKGRKRLLCSNYISELQFQQTTHSMMETIYEHIILPSFSTKDCICKLHLSYQNISCECDIYLPKEYRLIDCKLSSSTATPALEHWIQLLVYTCILRFHNYTVEYIAILNPFMASLYEINVSQWTTWQEFWNLFLEITSEKKNTFVLPSLPILPPMTPSFFIETEKLSEISHEVIKNIV